MDGGLQLVEIGLDQGLCGLDLCKKLIQSICEQTDQIPKDFSSASLEAVRQMQIRDFESAMEVHKEIKTLKNHLDQIAKDLKTASKKLSFEDYWAFLKPQKAILLFSTILLLGWVLINSIPEVKPPEDEWHYTFETPKDNWAQEKYDDSKWSIGKAPFGTRNTAQGKPSTAWSTPSIWLRREFTLNAPPKNQHFLDIFHDDDVEVFLNGTEILKKQGYSSGYLRIKLDKSQMNLLKVGKNTLAAHCINKSGAQIINLGIVE